MKKNDIVDGMKFRMENGQFCISELIADKMYFRFQDGTNELISLDQYNDNLKCLMKKWSIIMVCHYDLIPPLNELPVVFFVLEQLGGRIYEAHYLDKKCFDGYDEEIVLRSYNFNECEGILERRLFEETIKKYYINNKFGKKVYVDEDEIVLINEHGKKEVVSYQSLLDYFQYYQEK